MRKHILLPLVLIVVALTGCLQMESETIFDKNGNGTMACTITMKPEVAEAMKEMQGLDSDFADEDMTMVLDREKLEEFCKGQSVHLKRYKAIDEEDRVGTSFTIAFKDITQLEGMFGGGAAGIFKLSDGNYLMKSIAVEEDEDGESDEEMSGGMDLGGISDSEAFDPEMMAKQMEIMSVMMTAAMDLNVKMRITFPGDIVSHNAHSVEGRTCIWEINSSNMMMADDMEPEVVFSGKGLNIDAPAYD
ncbi:MAG: hypothetical protein GY835_27615 [bacterium]|nr:hypothetical protein [bacterium]